MQIFPDWNSLDSVRNWHTIFQVAGIALLALVIMAEMAPFRFGQRKDSLIAQHEATFVADEKAHEAARMRQSREIDALAAALGETNRKLAEIERVHPMRHLNQAQKQALSASLASQPKGKFTIMASAGVVDAREYAEEIAGVFRAAGWTVQVESGVFMENDASGAWVAARGTIGAAVPPIGQAIYNALKSADIPIRPSAFRDNNIPDGEDAMLKIGSPAAASR